MKFTYLPGATPIDPNDELDLIPGHITTQAQLNEAEYQNILSARLWSRRRKHRDLLSIPFAERLHKRMFGEVWRWAGKKRTVALQNEIFSRPYLVAVELKELLDTVAYRTQHAPPTSEEEWDRLAAEFHHRLVKIHYFRNGNGRHAREMTDLLLLQYNQSPFSWGSNSLTESGAARERYITALHAADNGSYAELYTFVRS